MNIPKGYKLVPVETLKFALGLTRHGFKNLTDQEADKYAALKTITELLEHPAPPQPIYDEARERELFETFQVEEGGNIDFENGYYDNVFVQSAWDGWKACAQSRAKAGEVGHE